MPGQDRNPRGIHCVETVTGRDGLERIPVIIASTSPHKAGSSFTPWTDEYDDDNGRVVYYGDNKTPGSDPLRKGLNNRVLVEQQKICDGDERQRRLYAVPILFFERVACGPRIKGNLKFHGVGIVEHCNRVTQDVYQLGQFENYGFDCCIFSLEQEHDCLDWQWIADRCDPTLTAEEANRNAPLSWKLWLEFGSAHMDMFRRFGNAERIITAQSQIPRRGSDEYALLQDIYRFYGDHTGHHFERLALETTRRIAMQDGAECLLGTVTEPATSNGGYNFEMRMDLGSSPLTGMRIQVVGRSSFGDLISPADQNEVLKFAANLKQGSVGAFVTTSYFNEASQRAIRPYRGHLMLANGITVAHSVRQELDKSHGSINDYLQSLESRPSSVFLERAIQFT